VHEEDGFEGVKRPKPQEVLQKGPESQAFPAPAASRLQTRASGEWTAVVSCSMLRAMSKARIVPLSLATKARYHRPVKLGHGELDKSGIAELTFPGRTAH
jgi:hypothetical protein